MSCKFIFVTFLVSVFRGFFVYLYGFAIENKVAKWVEHNSRNGFETRPQPRSRNNTYDFSPRGPADFIVHFRLAASAGQTDVTGFWPGDALERVGECVICSYVPFPFRSVHLTNVNHLKVYWSSGKTEHWLPRWGRYSQSFLLPLYFVLETV